MASTNNPQVVPRQNSLPTLPTEVIANVINIYIQANEDEATFFSLVDTLRFASSSNLILNLAVQNMTVRIQSIIQQIRDLVHKDRQCRLRWKGPSEAADVSDVELLVECEVKSGKTHNTPIIAEFWKQRSALRASLRIYTCLVKLQHKLRLARAAIKEESEAEESSEEEDEIEESSEEEEEVESSDEGLSDSDKHDNLDDE